MKFKSLLNALLFSFFSLATTLAFGQQFRINNGSSSKVLPFSHYYTFEIDLDNEKEKCCAELYLEGSIKSIIGDTITVDVSFANKIWTDDSNLDLANLAMLSTRGTNEFSFHKNELITLERFKSKKAMKKRETQQVIGGLLLITGATTLLNMLAVKDSGSRKNLLYFGLGEIVVGFTIGLWGQEPSYDFKGTDSIWFIE